MGCCGRKKRKEKSKTDLTNDSKRNRIEKKIDDKEKKVIPIDEIDHPKINENQVLKTEPEESITIVENPTNEPLISSPDNDIDDFIPKISSIDNISPIKTLNDLQKSVEKNDKPVSIVLFYGQYCPYSKRTIPELRQWARANQDRIFLYEVDVEQASNLAEYYHIRSIPTIMAFEENNLIVPIWQRTATNVLPSNESESIEDEFDDSNNLYTIRDPPVQKSVSINDIKQDQDEENTIDQSHSFDNIRSKSFTSSVQSPYIWNKSTSSMEITSQKSLEESFSEYNGRMISQSTISKTERKRTWSEYLNDNTKPTDYPQHIHLPNCNEIFYEKQFDNANDFNRSFSFDRFSTLTYQHIHNRNHPVEEICVLYLGPNRTRGFEENLPEQFLPSSSSKLSLITLQSNSFSE